MPYTYSGKLLCVDLTTRRWWTEPLSEEEVRRYLLGSGMAARMLWRDLEPERDALDPASPLFLMPGLLTGSFVPAACKTTVCGRSPLTGIWNESTVGGYWGAELKFAGYDGLRIVGRASEPVYIWIRDEEVEIRPAGHLWGLDTYQTWERLREETDPRARVACVGPAGERLVRLASVMFEGPDARAAGRGGMGALMASKALKAVAVRGHGRLSYHDEERLRRLVREDNARIRDNSVGMAMLGTAGGVPRAEAKGDFPLRNWRDGSWPEGAARVSGQAIAESILTGHYRCFACPIGCGLEVHLTQGPYAGVKGHGPEYETIAGFGGMCLVDELDVVVAANDLCNRYGLDTISTSAVIAFAMEAFEKGLISPKDTGGLELTWGKGEAVLEMVRRIAQREGLGDLLAQGVRAAARKLGPKAEEFAIHVKGMEVPYHDPRAFVSMAVNYATSNRGACHLEALTYWCGYGARIEGIDVPEPHDPHESRGAARLAFDYQNFLSVFNPLGLCKFIAKAGVGPRHVAQWVNAALGWEWDAREVMLVGERLFNLRRMINVGYGVSRSDDTLPRRFLEEPRPDGGAAGILPKLKEMLSEYYALRGWDEEGKPSPKKRHELGL